MTRVGRQCWTQAANPSPGKALPKDAVISPFHGSHLGCNNMARTLALSACVWASRSTKAIPPSSTGRDITNLEGRPLSGGPPSSTKWLRITYPDKMREIFFFGIWKCVKSLLEYQGEGEGRWHGRRGWMQKKGHVWAPPCHLPCLPCVW